MGKCTECSIKFNFVYIRASLIFAQIRVVKLKLKLKIRCSQEQEVCESVKKKLCKRILQRIEGFKIELVLGTKISMCGNLNGDKVHFTAFDVLKK